MTLHGLSWRVGVPFLFLVLAQTVSLALFVSWQVAGERAAALERLARDHEKFLEVKGLPFTNQLAEDIRAVTGLDVAFLGGTEPMASQGSIALMHAANVPADGIAREHGGYDCVAVRLDRPATAQPRLEKIPVRGSAGAVDAPAPTAAAAATTAAVAAASGDSFEQRVLVLARPRELALFHPRVVQVLVAFWLLAGLIAWLAVQNLVRPLRSLAGKLPSIESDAPVAVPEVARQDEIGDLARAFVATREAMLSERERRERAERLALLGRMTASLAHEIQNPVAAIKMHAQLWRDGGGRADATANVVEHEAARIEEMLNQWLFLSRPEPPALREQDVGELLRQIVRSHAVRLEHARVAVQLGIVTNGHALSVSCDGRRLGHVFGNLVANAMQAMPRGGTLEIDAVPHEDHVQIAFADTGPGFSPEALRRFGEFFFSEREGGMGIGLGVAKNIVEAHGGTLHVENRECGGARVTVELPRRPGTPAGVDSAPDDVAGVR